MHQRTSPPFRFLIPRPDRRGRRIGFVALPALALAAIGTVAPLATSRAEASVTQYSATTQWVGGGAAVNIRSAPDVDSQIVDTIAVGTALSIDCQTVGSRLGFSQYADNRTWDQLSDGRYIHDVVTSTPGGQHQGLPDGGYVAWSADIPRCVASGAPVAVSAPAAPSPSPVVLTSATPITYSYVVNSQTVGGGAVNVRVGPSRSASIAYTLGSGHALRIVCQTTGSRLGFTRSADNRTWDRLSDGRYVHDVVTTTPGGPRSYPSDGGYVSFSPGLPNCDDLAGRSEHGQPQQVGRIDLANTSSGGYPDADAQDCSTPRDPYSWCENGSEFSPQRGFAYRNCTDFVAWALKLTHTDVTRRDGTAINWRQGWSDLHKPSGPTPRVGAIAWWGASMGTAGHVGVVVAVNSDGSAQVAQYNRGLRGEYSVRTDRADLYLY